MTLPKTAVQSVRTTIGMLVEGEYQALESMTEGKRLNAHEISRAIEDYGRTLDYPPEQRFSEAEVFDVSEGDIRAFAVDIQLQTAEEGPSDLQLRVTLHEEIEDIYSVQIDGILVP